MPQAVFGSEPRACLRGFVARVFVRAFFIGVLVALSAPGLLAQTTIRGRVIGPDGNVLPDLRVLLHRVAGMSGANIAEAQSDDSGGFTMQIAGHEDTEAIYFLAARYEGELYIGEPFQPPFQETEYILTVGVPGTSASALIGEAPATATPPSGSPAGMPGGAPATNTRWLLFAIPAIMLLGVLAYFLLRSRTRIPERRRLLADIAVLDLEHAGSTDPEALHAYQEQRAALITQVRASGE